MKDDLYRLQELLQLNLYKEDDRLEIIKLMTSLKGYANLVDDFTNMKDELYRQIKVIDLSINDLTK